MYGVLSNASVRAARACWVRPAACVRGGGVDLHVDRLGAEAVGLLHVRQRLVGTPGAGQRPSEHVGGEHRRTVVEGELCEANCVLGIGVIGVEAGGLEGVVLAGRAVTVDQRRRLGRRRRAPRWCGRSPRTAHRAPSSTPVPGSPRSTPRGSRSPRRCDRGRPTPAPCRARSALARVRRRRRDRTRRALLPDRRRQVRGRRPRWRSWRSPTSSRRQRSRPATS